MHEGPCRTIDIAPFYLAKYAVSNAAYRLFMQANPEIKPPYYWSDQRFNQPGQPVVGVSWHDARRFAAWAGGRLPTEAEWEYATRAGTCTRYSWGNDIDAQCANYRHDKAQALRPVPVHEFDPNAWGLYQMHGNVYEWVTDTWTDRYIDREQPIPSPSAGEHVIRGGSWTNKPDYLRSAARDRFPADEVLPSIGFRLAQDVAAAAPGS